MRAGVTRNSVGSGITGGVRESLVFVGDKAAVYRVLLNLRG